MTLRVGVIGIGKMGKNHARVFSELSEVELIAVSDYSKELLNQITSIYSCRGYLNYHDMITNEELDAVTIAVPTKDHLNVAKTVLEKGIHTLVEKPIASSIREAQEMIDVAKENDCVLMVGHIERFNPAIFKLEELITRGELGKILTCSARRLGPYSSRITDVGIIIDWTVHDIDIMRLICCEEPHTVYCRGRSMITSFEDYVVMLLEFDNGIIGTIEADWLSQTKVRTISITGEKSFAELDYINQSIQIQGGLGDLNYQNFDELIMKVGHPPLWRPLVEKREPLKNELKDFVRAVKTNSLPKITGEDALQNLKIALAALQSMKKNKSIDLEQFNPS